MESRQFKDEFESLIMAAKTCSHPFIVKKRGEVYKGKILNNDILANCGKCVYCIKRRINDWAFRLYQQDKISQGSAFVTLTYDTKYCPITPKGFMTLKKSHFQDYIKRLRHVEPNLKYYAVGEYGDQKKRPHYHMIIFNIIDYLNIEKKWDFGTVHFGTVKAESVRYTLKYIDKNLHRFTNKKWDDREKEFAVMSKGLGLNYVNEKTIKWHNDSIDRNYVQNNEVKQALPKYYKDWIYNSVAKDELLNHVQKLKEKLHNHNVLRFKNENEYQEKLSEIQEHLENMYKIRKDNIN